MKNINAAIKEAGMTEGEAKVYLAMLKIGESTVGRIIEVSKVANSIIYRILDSLIGKGLASFIIKEKTKHFKAAEPSKIIEYIEKRKERLDESQNTIKKLLPKLLAIGGNEEEMSVQVYQGFKGIQTAFEKYHKKLKKGEEIVSWGIYPDQEEKYHIYWQKDHKRRDKEGIFCKMLFNQGTNAAIVKNRNSYRLCEARYMPSPIKTLAWFLVYKNVALIFLQYGKESAIEIINQDVADTFMAYFQDLWTKSKAFRY